MIRVPAGKHLPRMHPSASCQNSLLPYHFAGRDSCSIMPHLCLIHRMHPFVGESNVAGNQTLTKSSQQTSALSPSFHLSCNLHDLEMIDTVPRSSYFSPSLCFHCGFSNSNPPCYSVPCARNAVLLVVAGDTETNKHRFSPCLAF